MTGSGTKKTVLIVDDDADFAEVMRLAIAAYCDAETWVANNAKAGLELAREVLPDAIVVDVGLPGTDGLTLARWIRADGRFSGTSLIALTGYDRLGAACIKAGCDHFLLKPPDVSEICGLIERGRVG